MIDIVSNCNTGLSFSIGMLVIGDPDALRGGFLEHGFGLVGLIGRASSGLRPQTVDSFLRVHVEVEFI